MKTAKRRHFYLKCITNIAVFLAYIAITATFLKRNDRKRNGLFPFFFFFVQFFY